MPEPERGPTCKTLPRCQDPSPKAQGCSWGFGKVSPRWAEVVCGPSWGEGSLASVVTDWEALEMGLEMSTASFLCSHTSLGFLVSLGLSVSQAPEPRAGPWEGPLSAPA